jgi:hypothetical protein
MTTAYLLSAQGCYTGQTVTLADGAPRPANAVLVAPPGSIPAGKKAVWTGAWEIIDDPGPAPKDMVPKRLTITELMALLAAPGPGGMTQGEINATLTDTDFAGFRQAALERKISKTSEHVTGPTGFFAALIPKGRISAPEIEGVKALWPMVPADEAE